MPQSKTQPPPEGTFIPIPTPEPPRVEQRYMVLTHYSETNFEEMVNEALSNGFVPVGGVAISHSQGNKLIFAQSFIRTTR